MRRFLLLFAAFFLSLGAYAQLEVKENSFKEIPGFVNTNEEFQTDDNEQPFSVIVIKLVNITDQQARELKFDGDMRTYFEIEYKKGELWLYTSWYATYLKISHPDLSSVEYHLPFDMAKSKGYEMVLENKASVLEEGYASLSIITTPEDGAFVTLNGTVMSSTTPYKNPRVHAGKYTITVSKEYYQTVTQTIDLRANENRIVEIEMPYDAAHITFKADENTKVYVDDELVSTGGWYGVLTAGVYSVRYEKENYKPAQQTVVVKPNQDATYQLEMEPKTGGVFITTDRPKNVQIIIEGVNYGKTPQTINSLIIGEHWITLSKKKYEDRNVKVKIEEGKIVNVSTSLERRNKVGRFFDNLGRSFTNDGFQTYYVAFEIAQNQYNRFAYGISAGYVLPDWGVGLYVSGVARNVFKDHGDMRANIKCDKDFLVDGKYPVYTGKSTFTQLSLNGGLMFRCSKALSFRVGAGYGTFGMFYETTNKGTVEENQTSNGQTTTTEKSVTIWAQNKDVSYEGFEYSLGLQHFSSHSGLYIKVDFVGTAAGVYSVRYGLGFGR